MKTQSLKILAALIVGLSIGPALAAYPDEAGKGKPGPAAGPTGDFKKFDTNGDGAVSLAEFRAQGKDERGFTEADADRNGALNADEFIKAQAIDQRIQVGEYVGDAWITTKVKSLLLKDDLLNGMDIKVNTQDGAVQLSGWVKNTEQASRAVKIASGVQGVKAIHNDLSLKP